MKKATSLHRLYLLINKVGQLNLFPSKRELIDFLEEHDFRASPRTIDRDLAEIRSEFGIEVRWDASQRGYCIDREESWDYEGMLRLLEVCVTGDLLMQTIGEGKEALKYVLFDSSEELKGIELMAPVLQAVKLHRCLSFDYMKFHGGNLESMMVQPYAVKEYQNRWYLMGTVHDSKKIYAFGLDRIENLKILDKRFTPNKRIDPAREFDDIIGVTRLDEPTEEVILSFTPHQGNYVKTFPWHLSQEILVDDNQELRIKIRVIPNFELTQRILMHSRSVEVIKPDWLREEVATHLKSALEKYFSGTS